MIGRVGRVVRAILLCGLLGFAGRADAAIAHTFSSAASHGSTSNTVALPARTATGNLQIVMGCHAVSTSTMAIANTPSGVSWALAMTAVTDTTEGVCAVWWATPASGSQTITVSCGACASAFMSIMMDEWSGAPTISPIDGTASNHSTTTGGCNVSLGVTAATTADTAVWSGCLDGQTTITTGTSSCGTYVGGANDASSDGTAYVIRAGGVGVSCTVNHTTGTGAYIQMMLAIKPFTNAVPTRSLLGVGRVAEKRE